MNVSQQTLLQLFKAFSQLKVLIVGDVMIDSYLWGKVERISPEAPVPVVLLEKRNNMLGGAANVALNIKSLGAEPVLCSIIGNDLKGSEFCSLLEHENILTKGIIHSDNRITTTKFRIIGNNAQLLRVDEEIDSDLSENDENHLISKIEHLILHDEVNIIILQDYNKGVLTERVIEHIIKLSNAHDIPVVVDPKKKNFSCYKSIDLFKPNLKELREGLKQDIELTNIEKIKQACAQWQEKQNIKSLMVTLSENGLFMREVTENEVIEYHLAAHLRKIADVSGAGDTVISVASLCRALKTDTWLTAALSNIAGGLVCEHVGVVPVNGEQLLNEAIELLTSGLTVKQFMNE